MTIYTGDKMAANSLNAWTDMNEFLFHASFRKADFANPAHVAYIESVVSKCYRDDYHSFSYNSSPSLPRLVYRNMDVVLVTALMFMVLVFTETYLFLKHDWAASYAWFFVALFYCLLLLWRLCVKYKDIFYYCGYIFHRLSLS
jgi:hypothetical protein